MYYAGENVSNGENIPFLQSFKFLQADLSFVRAALQKLSEHMNHFISMGTFKLDFVERER